MARLTVVSFRLGGTDGVSIESEKWIRAFRALGHDVRTLAGDGQADIIMPELAIRATRAPRDRDLHDALSGADVVIVENLTSLPLNVPARDALYRVLDDRRALFRHHDLAWQRTDSIDDETPRDNPRWRHVTINDLSRRELLARGVVAETVLNAFDCAPPLGIRDRTRRALGVADEHVLLFPTRAIPRKNVAGALELAASLDATLWLLGPAEDGYESTLRQLVANSPARVISKRPEGIDIHDAYAACDLVVMPSTWEGFGNPVIESVTHGRPLAVYPYPVLREIAAFGFRFFDLDEAGAIANFLAEPDEELLEQNAVIAREHFNVANLPARLAALLETLDVN
jgi:mannosylglucosylglycerate synthase